LGKVNKKNFFSIYTKTKISNWNIIDFNIIPGGRAGCRSAGPRRSRLVRGAAMQMTLVLELARPDDAAALAEVSRRDVFFQKTVSAGHSA